MTKVLFCGCRHAYQDERYGAQMRVHNAYVVKGAKDGFRCTVCRTERAS